MDSLHCLLLITVIALAVKPSFALPEVIRIGKSNLAIKLDNQIPTL